MKTLTAITLAALALVAASPALAGQDAGQIAMVRRAMDAKKAEQMAEAKRAQQGLAGATGVSGKTGPSTQAPQAGRRDPLAHP